jgi:hypothetical protein
MVELYLHSPSMSSWCGAQYKKKHRDNFTFFWFFCLQVCKSNDCIPYCKENPNEYFYLTIFNISLEILRNNETC